VILKVLAEPCGLAVKDMESARALFARLKQEVTLVGPNQDGTDAVRHRADVRVFMLNLMRRDNPGLAERIHRRAAAYYAELSDGAQGAVPWARAEEIYHRLAVGDDLARVEARWTPGLEPYLQDAVDELPVRAKIYLATKLGLSLTEADRQEASLEERELSLANEAERAITTGAVETALSILASLTERSLASPLYRLEARALSLMGRSKDALEKANAAVEAAAHSGRKRELAEMLLLSAELSFRHGDLEHLVDYLQQAGTLCEQTGDAARLVFVLILLKRVYEALNNADEAREASRRLKAAADALSANLNSSEGSTRLAIEAMRAAAGELSPKLEAAASEYEAPPGAAAAAEGTAVEEEPTAEVQEHTHEPAAETYMNGIESSEGDSVDQLFTTVNRGVSS
jgi:tetratricopeptide (TPR) repeat protein